MNLPISVICPFRGNFVFDVRIYKDLVFVYLFFFHSRLESVSAIDRESEIETIRYETKKTTTKCKTSREAANNICYTLSVCYLFVGP